MNNDETRKRLFVEFAAPMFLTTVVPLEGFRRDPMAVIKDCVELALELWAEIERQAPREQNHSSTR